MTIQQDYKMSFSTGGLFLNESVEIARLHHLGEAWDETVSRALQDGVANLPKAASNRRTLRELVIRLRMLTVEELLVLVETTDRSEQQALLWLATCRAYRFIREFAIEVVRESYLSYQLDLPPTAFDTYFEAKAEWDDGLDNIKPSTRQKLRQVMFRLMREAGILSEGHCIQTALLSTRLKSMIAERNPGELALFPGIPLERA